MNKAEQYKIVYRMNQFAMYAPYLPIAFVFVLVYLGTLSWIVGTWRTYQGSHGPVILAISLYMIWMKRESIRSVAASPNLPFGIALTLSGCLLLVSGRVSSLLLLQYLSLVVTLLGLVLMLGGNGHLKMLWYPIGYIIFMFPIFSELLASVSIYLQTTAAWIAYHVLSTAGIAVYRQGHFLDLPSMTLDVARECNGINHIMALVSLAVPLACWTQKSWTKKLILIGAAFPIGVVANGLRVSIIGLYAYYKPNGPVHGPYDLFYVSFIFFFGMFSLMALSSAMNRGAIKEIEDKPSTRSGPSAFSCPPKQVFPIAGASAILLMTWSYLLFFKPEPVYLAKPIDEFPYRIGDWAGRDVKFPEPPFSYFLADKELKRVYSNGRGGEVALYVGYFPSQEQGKEIVHYRFDPLQVNARKVSLNGADGATKINVSTSDEMRDGRPVYFWYDLNGRVLTGRYAAKITTIFDGLIHRRNNAAIVALAVSRPDQDHADIEIIEAFFPLIQNYLKTKSRDAT